MILLWDNKSFQVIATIFLIAVIIFVSYVLYKFVKKDHLLNKEEKNTLIEGVLTKTAINTLITNQISKAATLGDFALMYIDLDKFDDFSSAFGPREAKKILTTIVTRLKKVLPREAKIARYKGDEFLVLFPLNMERLKMVSYANDVLIAVKEKINIFSGTEIEQTASIALCYFPQHGTSVKELIESLKIAIYNIKKNGGNDVLVYSQVQNDSEDYIEYFYQIRSAIEKREFLLYYQPIINIKDNQFLGFEALIRWNHPTLGLLGPNKFINIMEQSGDIHWVGRWGFETLLKSYTELSQVINYPFSMSINLSQRQLTDESLAINFQKILKRYKVNAPNITLEIGDFALFDKDKKIIDTLKRLKVLGFKLAIDGFGLDYSSLEKLDLIGVDIIKIDKRHLYETSFVAKKTLQMLTDYANEKNVTLVCEGVESNDDLDQSIKAGVIFQQGYLISEPLEIKKLKNYIENHLIMPSNFNDQNI